MKIHIKTHVFDIPQRLREIDPLYYVIYNTDTQKYEVHNSGQVGESLSLIIPFDALDYRTVELVLKTRIENLDKLIREIDEENQRIEDSRLKESLSVARDKTYDMVNYTIKKGTLPQD